MKILVTGGAGYIGSHTVVELLNAGYDVVVVDNLCNSSAKSLERVEEITGRKAAFYEADVRDDKALEKIFQEEKPEAVIHFAGLKAVGESEQFPFKYYDNNVGGTFTLVHVMKKMGCKNIVFSSSACVYGQPEVNPIKEDFPINIANTYGRTKYMVEQALTDLYGADNSWNVILLRYFNPIGAHESGKIGENPSGIPNNLLPYVAKVAVGKLEKINVFGNDYDTPDGTGVRDYLHVVDLAKGHVKAIAKIETEPDTGLRTYNLGTGKGSSVLEIIEAFSKACGKQLPYVIGPRRPGDVSIYYADPSLAKEELGWEAEYDLKKMCEDTWRWQSNNPNGYDD
ncbi:MAG: UDP-glucose 4-epimerase GalE [Lachnospiraceae bacterium]|nr:UDP-glucose 4-epimerase GalE [Lachnospiraceae bacterium]